MNRLWYKLSLLSLLCLISCPDTITAQTDYDESLYNALEYRSIGPYRGGRSAAVTGVPGQPMTYYFGGTGGGVWKSKDGGQSWQNTSDGYFGGSIGAVAVSAWDPNVIYAGGGEKTVRGNVSHGYGMWRSTDAGKTWTDIGLKDSRHISRLRIHPRNPDLVYAAVMGHLFGPNEQRGVYRSKDGGSTWERVHFVSNEVGAVDIAMDPTNPRILFASMWRILRTPYSLESGGEGSGIWKSTDGGDTWTEITKNNGLPEGIVGINCVTISPVNPERIWAIIEAEDGGVFRSEDGGETWSQVNDDRNLRQRAWYYTRIYADTQNEDAVYVLNVGFWKSKDGGKTYERIRTPHGDHHDLWIDPGNSNRMIIGDDGGAQVSFDGGDGWSTYHNQPTAQFYRVTTDNHFPYRIYGAQQDNSTVRILHRSNAGAITERHWEPTAGGESGHIAPNPEDPDIVYGGSYGGFLTRINHRTDESRSINVWPDNPMGHGAADLKYRFQWNYPIFFSPHDSKELYTTAQHFFKTTDEGQSWEQISPDLTRDDKTTMGSSGGPITKDNTSIEYYGTIFAALESPHEPGVLWAGTDDGLVHVSRNGGTEWKNVTPPSRILPEWTMINSMEAHPTEPGGLYLAATGYKRDDFRPYLFRTRNYGQSWERIVKGIPEDHFTRVIRADPGREGLLYAGTESGMYISFDDGQSWKSFQLNLPYVPITDLTIKENDLIVATQGRSFWLIDDITPLHILSDGIASSDMHLFNPRSTYRMTAGGGFGTPSNAGQNPPNGVMLRYYLKEAPDTSSVSIRILEEDGTLIRSYTAEDGNASEQVLIGQGMNQFVWNMRYPNAEGFQGLIMWGGSLTGPRAVPGKYQARLVVGHDSTSVDFSIMKDRRSSATQDDLQAQFDYLMEIREKLTETHESIKQIREIRTQVNEILTRVKDRQDAEEVKTTGKDMLDKFSTVEKALYQTRNRSGQDPLNYPIRLNNKLAAVASVAARGDFKPTAQSIEVKDELTININIELKTHNSLMNNELPAFNKLVRDLAIPAVVIEQKKAPLAQ